MSFGIERKLWNEVKITFSYPGFSRPTFDTTTTSTDFQLGGATLVSIRVCIISRQQSDGVRRTQKFYIKFVKERPENETTYTIKVSSVQLAVDKQIVSGNDAWLLLCEYEIIISGNIAFDILLDTVSHVSSFASLYADSDLTDFELKGKDGAVQFHKSILAAHSPVMKCMLSGSWKETREGFVDLTGITQSTLQHLKDFLYLGKLPDEGFEQLLLMASKYLMPDLEQRCCDKLLCNISDQNSCELLQFSTHHKISRLTLGILKTIEIGGLLKVANMENQFLKQ